MSKRLMQLLIFLLTPLLIVVGFSSWIIVGEKSEIVGIKPSIAVCYIKEQAELANESTTDNIELIEYTRIEKALEVANINGKNGISQTVVVYPDLKVDSEIYNIIIQKDCIIEVNVTLVLPYFITNGQPQHYNADFTDLTNTSANGLSFVDGNFSDSSIDNVNKYRKTLVTLKNGVTLTIRSGGKLLIGGQTGEQGQLMIGHTNGYYCEFAMEENSKIISSGGIECFGYFKEANNLNNGSCIELLSGSLSVPFIIYDFKGGTETSSLHTNKICPFNVYDLANLQVKVRIHSSASIRGQIRLALGKLIGDGVEYYNQWITVIGNSTNNVALILTSGYLDLKYTPETMGITTRTAGKSITEAYLNGNMTIGGIKLTVKVVLTVNIDTKDYYYPISYRYKFYICDGSFLSIPNKVKFLQGSELHVLKGGTLNVDNYVMFYSKTENLGSDIYSYPFNYETAKLINDGTINVVDKDGTGSSYVSALGAEVISKNKNAVLNVDTLTYQISDDDRTVNGSTYTFVTKLSANIKGLGYIDDFSTEATGIGVYISLDEKYNGLYLFWKKFTDIFKIKYMTIYTDINNKVIPDLGENISGPKDSILITDDLILPDYNNTLTNHKFSGWYLDSHLNNKVIEKTVSGLQLLDFADENYNVILYARLTLSKIIYVTYYGEINSSTSLFDENQAHNDIELYVPGEKIVMKDAYNSYENISGDVKSIHTFKGWDIYINNITVESGLFKNDGYIIPMDFNYESISIRWNKTTENYYRLSIVDSQKCIIAALNLVNFEEKTSKDYWVLPNTEIYITIQGSSGGLLSSGKKRTCTISTQNTKWVNPTSQNNPYVITAEGGAAFYGTGKTYEGSFYMPSGKVTLTTS